MVYSEVIDHHLQPQKANYTMRDFNRLQAVHGARKARFIIICSAIYYYGVEDARAHYSKNLIQNAFRRAIS